MSLDIFLRSPHSVQIIFSNELSGLIDNVQSLDTVQKIVEYCQENRVSILGNYTYYSSYCEKFSWQQTIDILDAKVFANIHFIGKVGCVSFDKFGCQEEFSTEVATLSYCDRIFFTEDHFDIETGTLYKSGLLKIYSLIPSPVYFLFRINDINKLKQAKKSKQSSLVS